MRTIVNRIYAVKTPAGWQLYHTALDSAALPEGEAREVTPVFRNSDGFMLGNGESVKDNAYVSLAQYGRGGNARRTLLAWKRAAFENGVWKVREASEIVFNHYVAGRRFLAPRVTRSEVSAWRGGSAALEVQVGREWKELARFSKAGSIDPVRLPDECEASPCPTIRLRGLAGCDLDWLGYDFAAEITGLPAQAVGAIDVREPGTGRTLFVL